MEFQPRTQVVYIRLNEARTRFSKVTHSRHVPSNVNTRISKQIQFCDRTHGDDKLEDKENASILFFKKAESIICK